MTEAKLTAKQRKFCDEYLVDRNATQAAIRAGYSKPTAHSIGSENLTKHEVRRHLHLLLDKDSISVKARQNAVIDELTAIAMSKITDVLIFENGRLSIKDIQSWPEGAHRGVESVRIAKSGEAVIKMHPKVPALKALGEHFGLYSDFGVALTTLLQYGHVEWLDLDKQYFEFHAGNVDEYLETKRAAKNENEKDGTGATVL